MPESLGAVEVSKDDYEARVPQLRVELINAQYALRDAGFPVLVVIAGPDQTGVGQLVHRLNEWMDARYTNVQVFRHIPAAERAKPWLYRAWSRTPARGEMAIFTRGYTALVAELAGGRLDDATFERLAHHQRQLEEDLIADGAVLVKLWLRIGKDDLAERVEEAHKGKGVGWRMDRDDEAVLEHYEALADAAARYAALCEPRLAPWLVIESADKRTRDLVAAETILAAIEAEVERVSQGPITRAAPAHLVAPLPDALAEVDLSKALEYKDYRKQLESLQEELRQLSYRARDEGLASVLAFEGWDAAGKGGVIRRITQALEVEDYRVAPIAAPTDEELAHHYLWRFWRRLPEPGEMTIFDRSWYGRVLVERIEGYATEAEWRRAYGEIVDFERQLAEDGWPVLKFWLHIDPEEQARRFRARRETPYKKYKITDEDLRNREQWDAYVPAVNEMVARTSTPEAPWHVIPANDKRYARVRVLSIVVDRLRAALG